MDQNNLNVGAQINAQEPPKPLYTSRVLMDKDTFYDFATVNYKRTKKIFLVFLILLFPPTVLNIIEGNYDLVITYNFIVSLFMILIYFKIRRSVKVGFERNVITAGENNISSYELFEDKIVSEIDGYKREFFYSQITGLFETEMFILLHLKHNLFVTIGKDELSASVDEVKAFLIRKCAFVKKKKFINCANDHTLTVIFLISLCAISLISIFIGLWLLVKFFPFMYR